MVKNQLNHLKKIALIQGGLGPEREISFISAQAVSEALDQLKIPYSVVECDQNLPHKLLDMQPDLAFLAVHGTYAEDGVLQGLLEYLKIPYTGSGTLASAICMDKSFFKDIITQHHIATPDYQNWNLRDCDINQILSPPAKNFPLVVKPARGGSSLGISICRTPADFLPAMKVALQYDTKIVVESYIEGTELALSFLDGKVLTPVEIVPKDGFYNYKNKYTEGCTDYILPPRVSDDVIQQCQKATLQVTRLFRMHSYCRADFIVNNNTPLMLEVNTLPGLTSHSLLPKSAQYDGIDFQQMVQIILCGASLDYEKKN